MKNKGVIDFENVKIREISKSNFTLFATRGIETGEQIAFIPIACI